MKKRLLIAILLALVVTLTLVTPASARMKNRDKPLLCLGDMAIRWEDPNVEPTWSGTISGDVNGAIQVSELPSYDTWGIYTFTEHFVIATDAGVIQGLDMGIWFFDTGKFRACGWVTDATGAHERLTGWMIYQDGVTVLDDDELGYTIDDMHVAFAPPLPAWWAKAWK
jgi:hypothetical protein